jgi:hypothetical protein
MPLDSRLRGNDNGRGVLAIPRGFVYADERFGPAT